MSNTATQPTPAELAAEASAWAVGLGILSMVLFPLALPLIFLTAAAALPLVLIVVAGGLIVAVVAAPILLLRRLGRAVRASRRSEARPGHRRPHHGLSPQTPTPLEGAQPCS